MAIRNILKYGDPTLRKISRSVLNFDDRLAQTLDDMKDTMYAAEGVGLAAPQIGVLRRYCIIDIGDDLVELVNPVIINKAGQQAESEGCLSMPGKFETTLRPMKVTVRAQDRQGNTFTISGEGLKARALCHEIDHLDGVLFFDRAFGRKE